MNDGKCRAPHYFAIYPNLIQLYALYKTTTICCKCLNLEPYVKQEIISA